MTPNEEARVEALEQRLAALEQIASGQKEPEGARERMQRERQERIEAKREARPDDDRRMGDPRPTSRARKEDLSRRSSNSLQGPQMNPPRPPQVQQQPPSSTTSDSHPFKLTTSVVSGVAKYTIGKGSITDGTNGSAIDLTGVIETPFTASAGHVVIKATVDPATLALSAWAAEIVSEADAAEEVKFNTDTTPSQILLRLHIGELTMAGGVATAWQALFSSVAVTDGLTNSTGHKCFLPAPTHPTAL